MLTADLSLSSHIFHWLSSFIVGSTYIKVVFTSPILISFVCALNPFIRLKLCHTCDHVVVRSDDQVQTNILSVSMIFLL